MNRIYVRMSGRLGNQLFRYAAVRYVQETQGGSLYLDFSPVYKEAREKPEELGFENSLKYFNIKENKLGSYTVLDLDKGNFVQIQDTAHTKSPVSNTLTIHTGTTTV